MGIQIGAALFAVYVFWGATFLAMRVAVESFPPMVMVAFRFISVGVIMLLWVGLKVQLSQQSHLRRRGIQELQ